MKKAKSLLAVAAVATALTCAVGMTACKKNGNTTENPKNDSQIAAVYQLYSANAQASGETVLTYEQWLESIKGPQGATGATGATGKSAYEIAKENGFEGTEAEWLASLKGTDGANGTNGTDGTNGTNGKSAYEIAQANGFTGTEAEWLASLKGEKGEDGSASTSPCVEGIYNTSDGLVVKFTDGTVKPVQDGGVTNQLLVVGENEIEVGTEITTAFTYAPVTIVSFYTLTGGSYKFTLYDPDVTLYEGTVDGGAVPFVDSQDPISHTEAFGQGTNDDGSFYSCLKFDKQYSFFIANWGTTAKTVRLTIERVA